MYVFEVLEYFTLAVLAIASFLVFCVLPIVLLVSKRYFARRRNKSDKYLNVAFFHPYCNAGGGGERVLWHAIEALQHKYTLLKIVVYTGDTDASPEDIHQKVRQRFNIKLQEPVEFVYLHKRKWVEASRYPYFTLLGQSLGSVILAVEALRAFQPDICIDSMGYAFTYPLFSFIGGCKVVSYTHYPTITSDMMRKIVSRRGAFNNRDFIARNPFLTLAKLTYYRVFAVLYKVAGRFADIVMVNSSWTEEHINSLWKRPMITYKVYPPCDTSDLQSIPLRRNLQNKKIKIVSVAQFRPEKDHPLQLKTMYKLRQMVSEDVWENLELVIVGSTRNEEDEAWVKDMKDLAKHLSLEENVTFKVNVTYDELKTELEEGIKSVFHLRASFVLPFSNL